MSLASRIWSWSEMRFWKQWYWLYKKNFKEEIDEKVIRISGALGSGWRTLTKENIIGFVDPDVFVESKRIVEQQRARQFQEFMAVAQVALQDPQTDRRFTMRRLARISRMKKDEISMMFPPTIHELRAEEENRQLSDNKMATISPFDDDATHIREHIKAAETPAKLLHIEAHKRMMFVKEMIKQKQEMGQGQLPQGQQQPAEQMRPVNQGQGQQQTPAGQRREVAVEGLNPQGVV